MLKKIGFLIMMLLTTAFTNVTFADNFENVVGYKDALNGDGFLPPLSEIINSIGKTDKLKIAINSKNKVEMYPPDNTEKVNDDVSIITVKTDDFYEFSLWNDNYQMSYFVANNSVYQVKALIYFNPNLSNIGQKKVIFEKTKNYLQDAGFKDNSSWFSKYSINEYSKNNIVVKFSKATTKKQEGVLITITNLNLYEDAFKLADELTNLKIKEDLKYLNKIFK